MADALAGGKGRPAIVAIASARPVYIPYHVVLAKADGDTAKNRAMNSPLFVISLGFIAGGGMRRQ